MTTEAINNDYFDRLKTAMVIIDDKKMSPRVTEAVRQELRALFAEWDAASLAAQPPENPPAHNGDFSRN